MKIRAYVLLVSVAIFIMSADFKNAKISEGITPGNLAPRIEFLGSEPTFDFLKEDGKYTLLQFWAAYDAESRVNNIKFCNEIKKLNSNQVEMLSISFDEKESIFSETVRIDQLEKQSQYQDKQGKQSDLYKKYKLEKGFKNFLIDDKGVILATNISADQLKTFLD